MTTVTPPAVVPGTLTPHSSIPSNFSNWLDPIIDGENRQALAVWQRAISDQQASINDPNSGWFAKASVAAAAGEPLPAQYPLPTMTWFYNDGVSANYQTDTITPVPNPPLVYPAIHTAASNPNTGQIAGGNPTTAADTQQSMLQYLVATTAQNAADLAEIKKAMNLQ